MIMEKKMVGALLLMTIVVCGSMVETAIGAVHRVGESAGWTTIGNVNYKQWAATKTFKLGDTIVFTYNKQFHNVMQVTHADYRSCNISAPIATYSTGNDSVIITTYGHHFYLCAVPGHCQAGQRVDINVQRLVSSTLAPTSSPPALASLPSPSVTPTSPTSSNPNSVAKVTSLWLTNFGLAVAFFVGNV
ncbi:mavicyanin-like isoform X1 [Rutidosis leptorrhynchoides]|uniref:mavicyanin-like isoform X1 n=1 Tax=Rutidosis leptorrhynchoides TaxID=125765 RepID=UPI003A9A2F1F